MGSSILHSASYCGYRLCGMKFLFEAIGRNTASAIALACLSLEYDEIVFVTPSILLWMKLHIKIVLCMHRNTQNVGFSDIWY